LTLDRRRAVDIFTVTGKNHLCSCCRRTVCQEVTAGAMLLLVWRSCQRGEAGRCHWRSRCWVAGTGEDEMLELEDHGGGCDWLCCCRVWWLLLLELWVCCAGSSWWRRSSRPEVLLLHGWGESCCSWSRCWPWNAEELLEFVVDGWYWSQCCCCCTDREGAADEADHIGINDADAEVLVKLITVEPMMLMQREITIAEGEMGDRGLVPLGLLGVISFFKIEKRVNFLFFVLISNACVVDSVFGVCERDSWFFHI